MGTSKRRVNEERLDIKVPKTSTIIPYIDVDNPDIKIPIYRRLELLLEIVEQTRYDRAQEEFDRFVSVITKLYPEKVSKIEKLRALAIWHILGGDDLTELYYEKLKEL